MKGTRIRGVRQRIRAGQIVGNPNTAGMATPRAMDIGDLARILQAAGGVGPPPIPSTPASAGYMLPLVTGALPGPDLVADGNGECVGVPLT